MDVMLVGLVHSHLENHSLAVLCRAVREAGFSARVVPFSGWRDMGDVVGAVQAARPRWVGISVQNTEAALASLTLARILKQRGQRVVCGGHFATLNAEEILNSPAGVDVVVRFAGEEALVGLLRGEPIASLPGAMTQKVKGAVPHLGGAIPRHARPPRLPEHLGFPAADLVVSRGCEAHCAYCCVAGAGDLLKREQASAYTRPATAQIAEEIAWLWHEKGARVFNFMDDNLLPLSGAEAFLRELQEELARRRVGRFAFSLQLRADAVTDEVAAALAELGLMRAYVGIDGYSATQLRQLGRDAPADAGARAIERLTDRGVYCLANALLFGPTIPFPSLLAEIEGLRRIRRAPVHLLPIDARAGTAYFERAQRRGLMEGGFLWRHYRFEDERTARAADVILSMPTRLIERSPPIALYDLGYNLGIARRLLGAADDGSYARISEAWNADQLRLLSAACDAAARGSVEELKALERDRVRAHDEALVAECDGILAELERRVSRSQQHAVEVHTRGRILSSVALAMGLAACRTQPFTLPPPDAGSVENDLSQGCSGERMPQAEVPMCLCPYGGTIRISFDSTGVVIALAAGDGSPLPPDVQSCLDAFFKNYCYPSLAGTTQDVLSSHCWVA